jgi:16S rRNA pseudouridine516 synthase
MKSIRIDKLLANLGYGSRREVGMMVRRGEFILDGTAILDAAKNIPYDPDLSSRATFMGEQIDPISPFTLMLNKPRGFTCSHDEQGMLIYDLMPYRWRARSPQMSSVGRLDKESTGLVLVTDDGDFLHRVISPKHHVWKEYEVTLADPLKGDETEKFGSGTFELSADKTPLKPATWTATGPTSGVMALQEGRYHQIRRMFGAVGNKVETLHRRRIGGLDLGGLPEGTYRPLTPLELAGIFATAE